MEYYTSINIPLLAILFYMENKKHIQDERKFKDILSSLFLKQVGLVIDTAIEEKDYHNYFQTIFTRIKQITTYFPVIPKDLQANCEKRISQLKSLKLTCIFLTSLDRHHESLAMLQHASLEV